MEINMDTEFQEIRNYCFLDLQMEAGHSTIIARSVISESKFTNEDPWDILSRFLIQEEEEADYGVL